MVAQRGRELLDLPVTLDGQLDLVAGFGAGERRQEFGGRTDICLADRGDHVTRLKSGSGRRRALSDDAHQRPAALASVCGGDVAEVAGAVVQRAIVGAVELDHFNRSAAIVPGDEHAEGAVVVTRAEGASRRFGCRLGGFGRGILRSFGRGLLGRRRIPLGGFGRGFFFASLLVAGLLLGGLSGRAARRRPSVRPAERRLVGLGHLFLGGHGGLGLARPEYGKHDLVDHEDQGHQHAKQDKTSVHGSENPLRRKTGGKSWWTNPLREALGRRTDRAGTFNPLLFPSGRKLQCQPEYLVFAARRGRLRSCGGNAEPFKPGRRLMPANDPRAAGRPENCPTRACRRSFGSSCRNRTPRDGR